MQGSREEPRAPHGLGGAGVGRRPERPSAIPGLPSGRAGVLPAGDPRLGGTAGRPRTLLLSEARRRLPAVAAKRPRGPTWPPPLPPQSRASRGAPAAGARGGGGGTRGGARQGHRSPTRSPAPEPATGQSTGTRPGTGARPTAGRRAQPAPRLHGTLCRTLAPRAGQARDGGGGGGGGRVAAVRGAGRSPRVPRAPPASARQSPLGVPPGDAGVRGRDDTAATGGRRPRPGKVPTSISSNEGRTLGTV